jgi:cytochrome c5
MMTKIVQSVIFGALVSSLACGVLYAQSAELPPGAGQDIAQNSCTICHNASIITQQHLSPAAWTKEVDKMIRWNAPVLAADHDTLIKYLSGNFSVRPDAALTYDLPAGSGREVVQSACLSCHDASPILSAPKSSVQWVQTVNQMQHFGTKLTPRQRAIVLNYLSKSVSASPLPPGSSIEGR